MTEWYRRKTWTKTDEEEFFAKLGRARKDGRAQYLKIQAIELVETRDQGLLEIAESLLNKMLTEYPDDNFNKSSALHTLGDISRLNGNLDKAIDFFKQAIDFEVIYPKVQTNAYLDYSELIVKTGKINQFDIVQYILLERLPGLLFPVAKYKVCLLLSIIYNTKGKSDQAQYYADLADQNALADTSGLRYHKNLGVVKELDSWLESLVKRNK